MQRVYISSTIDDLVEERSELSKWLTKAGHQPVESYIASTETLLPSCFADIASCNLFVLILGDRYGAIPGTGNNGALSVIHLEYREARRLGLPCMVFERTTTPNKALSDLDDPERRAGSKALKQEIADKGPRPATFRHAADLVAAFSVAFHHWTARMADGDRSAQARTSATTARVPLTAEGIARAVHRSAVEGLKTPQDWFENWSDEVFTPPLPPSHALLHSCFIDTGLRGRVIATLKAGGQTGITGFIGMGGVGKTFTALRIAWDLRSEGWQICWVSLLQRSATDVLDDIAHNFGFRFVPNLSVGEKVAALRTTLQLVSQKLGKVLIVLDNAEQFPDFAEVVGALSHLPVLVTSRTSEQAGRIRYERIEPLTNDRSVSFCVAFLNTNRETAEEWMPTDADCSDLVDLAELYKGHPLSLRMALTGFQRLPRALRAGRRPLQHLLQILKERGLEGFAKENTTIYSSDEPSERVLRHNMEATFQWLYDDLASPAAPLVDRVAFLILPLCAAVGAATFDIVTVTKAATVLWTLLPRAALDPMTNERLLPDELPDFLKSLANSRDLPDFPNRKGNEIGVDGAAAASVAWHDDIRQLAESHDLVRQAVYRLESISLIDPVTGQTDAFAMHPTVREFALRQEDPSGGRRPSSDMLLRAALGTLVEGINVSDALLNLLPWLKGRRSLVEQACDNLAKKWHAEEYRSFRTTRVWAEQVLELAKDLSLTEQVVNIQCRLGELMDRMDEPTGLPMLHEALQMSNATGETGNWPAYDALTLQGCLQAMTPRIYGNKTLAWAAVYLATELPDRVEEGEARAVFRALRWALDEDGNAWTWNRLGARLCGSLDGGPANIVGIHPFDTSSSNAYAHLARLFERWTQHGVAPDLAVTAQGLADRVKVFSEGSANGKGVVTPQHWIALRIACLGFELLHEGLAETQFLAQVATLRDFSLAQGIRAFRLEYNSSLLLALNRMRQERWDDAAGAFRRAIAASREIPRHVADGPQGRHEMSLLQSACESLGTTNCIGEDIAGLLATDSVPCTRDQARLLPYVQLARACGALKGGRIAYCHDLAMQAVHGLQRQHGTPTYLRPLLQRLAGTWEDAGGGNPIPSEFRADWEHLPDRVVCRSDGRPMRLVRHGIGVLKDGKAQGWLWPFYIDDEPLTVKDVREMARRAGLSLIHPRDADDACLVESLEGKPLARLLEMLGKTFPTAQEQFAAAAQHMGMQRLSSDDIGVLDRLQLATIQNVLDGTMLCESHLAERVRELLKGRGARPASDAVGTRPAKRTARVVNYHSSGAWIGRSEPSRLGFESWWLPRFRTNKLINNDKAALLAKRVLISLSLNVKEKLRVALAAPTLTEFQVTELLKVFTDEGMKYAELWPTEADIIQGLITRCKIDARILLSLDLSGVQGKGDDCLLMSCLVKDRLTDEGQWHMQLATRDNIEHTQGASLTTGKLGNCIRLVRPILTVKDMDGLVPVEDVEATDQRLPEASAAPACRSERSST